MYIYIYIYINERQEMLQQHNKSGKNHKKQGISTTSSNAFHVLTLNFSSSFTD